MNSSSQTEYTEATVARLELLWGEGFMSVGGPAEVSAICQGIDLNGRDVIDIGCGIGGVDFLLVTEHGAASVLGLDVSERLLDFGRLRAHKAGLADKITFRRCAEPPYPVPNSFFDVAFSKGAILHIPDKSALFRDLARCLKPGGIFIASDWLQGDGAIEPDMATQFGAAEVSLVLASAERMEAAMHEAGFTCIEMSDKTEQYLNIARQDLCNMKGPLLRRAIDLLGAEGVESWVSAQSRTVDKLAERWIKPMHFRAILGSQ